MKWLIVRFSVSAKKETKGSHPHPKKKKDTRGEGKRAPAIGYPRKTTISRRRKALEGESFKRLDQRSGSGGRAAILRGLRRKE